MSLSWSIADNIKTTNIWVLKTTDAGVKTNFDVIAGGVALSDTDTAHTFANNQEGVTYFFWLTYRDAAGNYTTTRTSPASLTPDMLSRTAGVLP